jgi:hypothetical protein
LASSFLVRAVLVRWMQTKGPAESRLGPTKSPNFCAACANKSNDFRFSE